jgi:hypothetical protein
MPDAKDPRFQAFLAAAGLQKPAFAPVPSSPQGPGRAGRPLKRRLVDSPEPESQLEAGRKYQSLAERMAGGLHLPGDSQETPACGLGGLGAYA